MSYYYKYKFTSPQPIFAQVKEELKSFMDTGAVDDTLFPLYTEDCLKKLGKSAYPINQAMLCTDTFEAKLPDDFYAIREAWACSDHSSSYQLPSALYTQIGQISTRIDTPDLYCNLCNECQFPDVIQAIYKTTHTVAFEWKKQYLLKPGNIYPACPNDLYCANYNAISEDTYDIRDNKFVTSFREGKVYIQYYSLAFDAEDQLVPDTYRVKKFIELYLKQKIFEQLWNQATDDSATAMEKKYREYMHQADEAYIIADTEEKKEDVYRKQRAIRRVQNRFRKYDIR